MRWLSTKRIWLTLCIITAAIITYIVVAGFILPASRCYLVGDVFGGVGTPSDETLTRAFAQEQINWEIAYWSAMISEYTFEKPSYPAYNRALSALGFTTMRIYSFFEHEGELKDDIMVDAGIKEIFAGDGTSFTLVVIAFRGSVPIALDSPTTRENMRRNIDFLPRPWGEAEATVHRGFYGQYRDFVANILPEINDKLNLSIMQNSSAANHSVKFWLTGHSMGGALAELFTLGLVESGIDPAKIMTYGFATPLVASRGLQEHAQLAGASDRIFRIIHRRDMVAFVGYRLLWGRSLAADDNVVGFGRRGVFDRRHHSLPRVYLPFVISQNDQPLRQYMEVFFIVDDM